MAYSNSIQSHSNVYNYYMTTYAPKSSTPYDTHKKSELRSVYNSIVKMNKDAPIYILDTSKESCAFAFIRSSSVASFSVSSPVESSCGT